MNPNKCKDEIITHNEIANCLDKAIFHLSPGSITNILEQDKSNYKSPAIKLLKNLCSLKKEDAENENQPNLKEKQELINNELASFLYQSLNQEGTPFSISANSMTQQSNLPTPNYNLDTNQFINNILQQPTTFKSNLHAGNYQNGFSSFSPVLYNNTYANEMHNVYSSHLGRFSHPSMSNTMQANINMTPFTGLPLNNYYYQGFPPQSINPSIGKGTPHTINTPYHGVDSIDVNNLGISLIKLNQQTQTQQPNSGNLFNLGNQHNTKPDANNINIRDTQTNQNSISLKDMIKKDNVKKAI